MIGLLLLTASCREGSPADNDSLTTTTGPASSITTSTATSSAKDGNDADCPGRPRGSSPSQFEPARGTYSAQVVTLEADPPSLTFDVVQWLTGEDAREAWLADNPGDPDGPPNDYYIVNANGQLRTAPVGAATTVRLTHLRSDSTASLELDTLAGLGRYLVGGSPSDTYWLTFDRGVVTEICEQYRP